MAASRLISVSSRRRAPTKHPFGFNRVGPSPGSRAVAAQSPYPHRGVARRRLGGGPKPPASLAVGTSAARRSRNTCSSPWTCPFKTDVGSPARGGRSAGRRGEVPVWCGFGSGAVALVASKFCNGRDGGRHSKRTGAGVVRGKSRRPRSVSAQRGTGSMLSRWVRLTTLASS